MYVNAAFCCLLGRAKGELLGVQLPALLCSSALKPAAAGALQWPLGDAAEAVLELVSRGQRPLMGSARAARTMLGRAGTKLSAGAGLVDTC